MQGKTRTKILCAFSNKAGNVPRKFCGTHWLFLWSLSEYRRQTGILGRDDFKRVNDAYSVHILTENKKAKWEYESASAKIQQFITIALRKLGRTPIVDKADLTFDNVRNMMKHSALHKKGSGARINTHQINPPLQWNEVTELAHWEGKGNASVIASNIR